MGKPINVSFKDTEEEIKLKTWIVLNSKIVGKSNFIKQILYKEMLKGETK